MRVESESESERIHLDLLLDRHCVHDEVIIVLTDQCRSRFGVGRLRRRRRFLALHAWIMLEGTFVSLLTIAL